MRNPPNPKAPSGVLNKERRLQDHRLQIDLLKAYSGGDGDIRGNNEVAIYEHMKKMANKNLIVSPNHNGKEAKREKMPKTYMYLI